MCLKSISAIDTQLIEQFAAITLLPTGLAAGCKKEIGKDASHQKKLELLHSLNQLAVVGLNYYNNSQHAQQNNDDALFYSLAFLGSGYFAIKDALALFANDTTEQQFTFDNNNDNDNGDTNDSAELNNTRHIASNILLAAETFCAIKGASGGGSEQEKLIYKNVFLNTLFLKWALREDTKKEELIMLISALAVNLINTLNNQTTNAPNAAIPFKPQATIKFFTGNQKVSFRDDQSPKSITVTIGTGNIINPEFATPNTVAIVNAANQQCVNGYGVTGAIFTAADAHKMQTEVNKLPKLDPSNSIVCRTGTAVITGAGNLENKVCDHVIHAVAPDLCQDHWKNNPKRAATALECSYLNSLVVADKKKLTHIAFPSLGTGVYGNDPNTSAKQARLAVEQFAQTHPHTSIKEVRFVLFDKKTAEAYAKVFSSSNQ